MTARSARCLGAATETAANPVSRLPSRTAYDLFSSNKRTLAAAIESLELNGDCHGPTLHSRCFDMSGSRFSGGRTAQAEKGRTSGLDFARSLTASAFASPLDSNLIWAIVGRSWCVEIRKSVPLEKS